MNEEPEFDPATRRLCPDGSCVGILDRAGRCAECGRLAAPSSAEAEMGLAENAMEGEAPASPTVGEAFDASRQLCADGSCVGVVRDDGKCNICGRMSGS